MIDASTDLGKLRLRCADHGDIPYLPDSVYTQTLADQAGNLPSAAKICATYILGMLSFKTHRKMGLQLEVWGAEAFENYKEFLLLTVKDPSFVALYPVPYSSEEVDGNIISDFISDWSKNYYNGTESQALAVSADRSPNQGGRYGFAGLI